MEARVYTDGKLQPTIRGTKFLYCKYNNTIIIALSWICTCHKNIGGKHLDVINDQFELLDVPDDCNVMDFARVHIPGYSAESGYGYHEFKNKMYIILPETKLMLMDDGEFQPQCQQLLR